MAGTSATFTRTASCEPTTLPLLSGCWVAWSRRQRCGEAGTSRVPAGRCLTLSAQVHELQAQMLYRAGRFDEAHKVYSKMAAAPEASDGDDFAAEREANLLACRVGMTAAGVAVPAARGAVGARPPARARRASSPAGAVDG